MGRLHEACGSAAEFRQAMQDALVRMTAGSPREQAKRQMIESYQRQMEMVRKVAAERGLPLPETDYKKLSEVLDTAIIERGSTPTRVTADGRLEYVVEEGLPKLADDYDFVTPPPWDHDDCAEYCLDPDGLDNHKRLFSRWLAHQWAVRRIPEARAALAKQFQPLLKALLRKYGDDDAMGALQGYLNEALDQFDFYRKEYAVLGDERVPLERDALRMQGKITSDFELPIALFVARHLKAHVYGEVEAHRVEGPFTIDGDDGKYLLIEDVQTLLGISASQIRRRVKQGELRAEKPEQIRGRLGLRPSDEVVLRGNDGEVRLGRGRYWIFRADDVLAFRDRKGDDGYRLRKPGRPRKSTSGASGDSVPRASEPRPSRKKETDRPRARKERDGEASSSPASPPPPAPRPRIVDMPQAMIVPDDFDWDEQAKLD